MDLTDLNVVLSQLFRRFPSLIADANGDGNISAADVAIVVRHLQ